MLLTPPLKTHGGKWYLADWIISLMPDHMTYCEPFCGGCSVLLKKEPDGISEVVNDLDGDLTNFWNVLRSPSEFEELRRFLEATPMSEELFDKCAPVDLGPSVDRAFRFFVRARQSRQGLKRSFATISTSRTRRGMNEQVSAWLTAIDGLPDVHARLKRVLILHEDALSAIDKCDSRTTHFYVDPPYPPSTRSAPNSYGKYEMSDHQHAMLLEKLARISGTFQLSSYPCDLYDVFAQRQGWYYKFKAIDNKASPSKTKEIMTEGLWMNYEPPEQEA